jgi:NADH dehydrogenase
MKKRIVIIGGGFVGALAARELAQARLPQREVILLSQTDHFLFAPLLIESLAGDIAVETCSRMLRPWAKERGVRFIQGKVIEVRRESRTLTYQDGESTLHEELAYEDLVFAQGGSPNFFRTIGAEERAFTLKRKEDVEKIHARIQDLVIKANAAPTEEEKRSLLTFGVAGGGPAGIESVCSLRTYLRKHCRKEAKELLPLLSFFVIESSPDILPGFPEKIREGAKRELKRQNIALYTGEAVTEVRAGEVATPARTIKTSLLLWTAGIAPNTIPLVPPFDTTSPTGLPLLKNSVSLDEHHFVAGDIAAIEWNTARVPKNGQIAMQLGHAIAQHLIRRDRGETIQTQAPQLKGFFLGMGESGFLSISSLVLESRLVNVFRLYFYRFRMWQIL